jgi:hypothetical protein
MYETGTEVSGSSGGTTSNADTTQPERSQYKTRSKPCNTYPRGASGTTPEYLGGKLYTVESRGALRRWYLLRIPSVVHTGGNIPELRSGQHISKRFSPPNNAGRVGTTFEKHIPAVQGANFALLLWKATWYPAVSTHSGYL